MKKSVVALLAALEAFLAVAIGIGIVLVPLTVLWAVRLDLGIGWDVFWRASVDTWLLGHGVHFAVTLDPKLALATGLPGAEQTFLLSLTPIAFAVITVFLGMRLGRKTVEAEARFIGPLTAVLTFAGLNAIVVLTVLHPAMSPTLWRAFALPPLVFLLGLFIGARGEIGRSGGRTESVRRQVTGWARALPTHWREVFRAMLVGGTLAVSILIAIAGVMLALGFIINFATVIRLYEGLQAGAGGGFILTLGQLAFIPDFVVWMASWLTGAGFSIGVGSSVSPAGTTLGLIPSLPIFGVIPTGQLTWGYLALLAPVLGTVLAALIVRQRLVRELGGLPHLRWLLLAAVGIAAVGTAILVLLAWFTTGAAGPGRMAVVGAQPGLVAAWAGAELLVAALIGMLAPGLRRAER